MNVYRARTEFNNAIDTVIDVMKSWEGERYNRGARQMLLNMKSSIHNIIQESNRAIDKARRDAQVAEIRYDRLAAEFTERVNEANKKFAQAWIDEVEKQKVAAKSVGPYNDD